MLKNTNEPSSKIASAVKELVVPTAEQMDIFVWDVEYVKEGSTKILRITIDSEEGIDIDICEKFHRAIDPIIDEADPIAESYTLEVSSPGVERELKYPMHIEACEGWDVEVKLFAPVNGAKLYSGVLVGYDEDGTHIVIKDDSGEHSFDVSAVASVKTCYDWDNDF